MTVYESNHKRKLSDDEIQMLKKAEKRVIVFDEDSPEFSDEELAGFRKISEINREKRSKTAVSIRLPQKTVQKAKSLGKGYTSVLSRIIVGVLDDNELLKKYL